MDELSKRQKDAFTQREGEGPYDWVDRTMRTLRYKDLPRLALIRSSDKTQVDAIKLYVDLKMVKWTRALAFGTVFLGVCTIVAAFIVR